MPSPYDYHRDDAKHRISVRLHAQLRLRDYLAIIDRQADEGTWGFAMLYDVRGSQSPLEGDAADLLAAHVYRKLITIGPRGPVAVVATAGDVVGPVQLYAFNTARAGITMEIFWALPDAESWLDSLTAPRSGT